MPEIFIFIKEKSKLLLFERIESILLLIKMKMRMHFTRRSLMLFAGLMYLPIILLQPLPADASKFLPGDASELTYTIQIGSFEDIERATEQFQFVIDRLDKGLLHFLRLEKIGQYYSIRVGSFEDLVLAADLHRSLKHHFSSSILMKAYIKKERIIKRYSHKGQIDKANRIDYASASDTSELSKPLIHDKKKGLDGRLYYTIQIGSFIHIDRARDEFASSIQKLPDTKPNHIRIEKIGEYFTLRIGNFTEYMQAEKHLSSVKTHFVSAFIIQAYMRDERIVRQSREDPTQKKDRANIQAKPFNSISPVISSKDSVSIGDNRSEKNITLPVSNKLLLRGTLIANNVRLAIIEEQDTKKSGLYNLNEQVGEFTISNINEKNVILTKNNAMVRIMLWADNKNVSSNPEPVSSNPKPDVIKKSKGGRFLERQRQQLQNKRKETRSRSARRQR